ncbi:uncharacterized protein LOC111338611 [Stylophora pistillata]|uniref:uncharacterized protein LOC111338611 n=1 Tax=Stylophora pistillata TaxID=50429 RepID=UPI000C043CF9|nr:uncharacterized protein LOC111338611 [Stylophora pistillata]
MDCEDSAVDPTSSDSEGVETICPSSGPTKGGISVLITLGRKLPRGVKSGICEFVQVGVSIQWEKINSKTIKLTVPAAKKPGAVVLRVTTETNEFLGETIFVFVDEGREAMETLIENPKSFSENSDLMPSLLRGFSKLVKDPSMQKTFFHMMYSQDGGMSENNSTVAENLTQDSTIQANYSQALEVLLRLVYIAVEEVAHQFIEMIYSTSAGKILVGSYNNELPLPEDVARAKGHFKLAEYLQDVNIRFSNENGSDVQSKSIDWFELFQAVDRMQTQPSESGDERDFGGMPSLEDSNLSDYFADVEPSSCGSFEVDSEWAVSEVPNDKKESSRMQSKDDNQSVSFADAETSPCDSLELISDWSDLEEKSGARTEGEDCEKAAIETDNDDSASLLHDRPLGISVGFLKENATEESFEDKTQLGSDQDNIESPSIYGKFSVVNFPVYRKLPLLHGFVQWLSSKEGDLSAEQQEKCSHQAEEMGSVSQKKGTQRKDYKVPGQKCATSESSSQEKTTKSKKHRQRGHRRFKTTSRMRYILLTAALVTVLVGLKLGESQILHWAVGNGYTQFSKLLLKCGLNVDAPNFRMESPLHVAAKFGFVDLADVLTKLGSNVSAKTYQQQTPLHLAVWNGHQQIAAMLLQRGGDAQSGDVFGRTPVHLAVVQGRERMLEMLIQHGSALKARDDLGRTPLHLASLEGNEGSVKLLIRYRCEISARDNSLKTALHLAAESGQATIVGSLIMRGADIQATDLRGQTPLHLAVGNGHHQIAAILLQRGSDAQRGDGFGRTPVHLAAVQGRERMPEVLTQHQGFH